MSDSYTSELQQKHYILNDNKCGIRKAYSTEMALIVTLDKSTEAIDNHEYVIGSFLDFKKAFDTVDNDILLLKLGHYGLRGLH